MGKARPGVARAGSAAYLRHWFVDRLFDQWDYWVGAFVKDTLLANGFYRALGADVAWTASVDALLHGPPDLVSAGPFARIEGGVARQVEAGGDLRFARVSIGARATVEAGAVLSPGAALGDGAVLAHLASTLPGQSFEDGGRYAGSPAVRVGDAIAPTRPAGKAAVSPKFDGAAEPLLTGKRHRTYGGADDDDAARRRYYRREAGKLLCFVPILYVPFVSSLAASALCFRRVHWWEWPFRYRNLLFWILL